MGVWTYNAKPLAPMIQARASTDGLKKLGAALLQYAADHDGTLPPETANIANLVDDYDQVAESIGVPPEMNRRIGGRKVEDLKPETVLLYLGASEVMVPLKKREFHVFQVDGTLRSLGDSGQVRWDESTLEAIRKEDQRR